MLKLKLLNRAKSEYQEFSALSFLEILLLIFTLGKLPAEMSLKNKKPEKKRSFNKFSHDRVKCFYLKPSPVANP